MSDDGPRPIDSELFAAVRAFVADARDAFREQVNERTYMPTHYRFPVLSRHTNSGFPFVRASQGSKVVEYDHLFAQDSKIAFGEWESWKRLVELVESHDRLLRYLAPTERLRDPSDEWARRMFLISVQFIPLRIFDRLMHLHGINFDDAQLLDVYVQLERGLLAEKLSISYLVPVVLTKFELDDEVVALGPQAALVRLTDDLQMARCPEYQAGVAVNELVLGTATHALLLTGWEMTNPHQLASGTEELDWYPLDLIDRFFTALRIAAGIDTGYAQVAILPVDWARTWRGDLPAVEPGALGRRYPAHFEKFAWNRTDFPAVAAAEIAEAAAVFRALEGAHSRLRLAGSRLSAAMLRESESDAILDLCIGLEAALGDENAGGEILYKLRLRTAAVMAQDDTQQITPEQVFDDLAGIYAYRSAVAHGAANQASKRLLLDEQRQRTRPANGVARDYLRRVLAVLCSRPELSSGAQIDRQLLVAPLRSA